MQNDFASRTPFFPFRTDFLHDGNVFFPFRTQLSFSARILSHLHAILSFPHCFSFPFRQNNPA
jgi:hypothetical protein